MGHFTRKHSTWLALLTALLLAGCTPTSPQPEASVSGFADLFTGYGADYDPASTPMQLASMSDVVISGKITAITPGRYFGRSVDDPGGNRTIVLNIKVDAVLAGALPRNQREMVFVELPSPGNAEASVYDRHVPKDREVVLYLIAAAGPSQTPIVDPDAGRPAGRPLYQPVNPQGFVMEDDGAVVQVLEKTTFSGTDITSFVPEAERFPVDLNHPREPEVTESPAS